MIFKVIFLFPSTSLVVKSLDANVHAARSAPKSETAADVTN